MEGKKSKISGSLIKWVWQWKIDFWNVDFGFYRFPKKRKRHMDLPGFPMVPPLPPTFWKIYR